jgi:hypothetical protein
MESRTDTPARARRKARLQSTNQPISSPALTECPREIPVSTPSYKSFEHIRNPKQRRAKEYEQHLLILRDMYPEYGVKLDEQIAYAKSQQERNRVSDRERIHRQLEDCPLSCREVAEDLEMPYPTVYKILQSLAEDGLVIIRQRAGRFGQKPVCYYELAH